MLLAYVWDGDSISNAELQQLLGLNTTEVGKILHQMVEKQIRKLRESGIIRRKGGRFGGYWEILQQSNLLQKRS